MIETAVPTGLSVDVVRGGFVESRHHVRAVVLAADGSITESWGDPDGLILPRSAAKPMQATGLVELGLDLPPNLLALASSSNSGEDFHIDGVREILAKYGNEEERLYCPPDLPLEERVRYDYIRSGRDKQRVVMNCAAKHSAMLGVCRLHEWDLDTYCEPDHPLQQHLREVVGRLSGTPVAFQTFDGCGAPLFSVPLVGLARAMQAIGGAPVASAGGRVAAALRGNPEWVAGVWRAETALAKAVPGIFAKMGAEGIFVAVVPDGRAVVLKVADGANRAWPVAAFGMLAHLGLDLGEVAGRVEEPVLSAGRRVGTIALVMA